MLSYIAYHRDIVPRLERANKAKILMNGYNAAQQDFINFVLDQYVAVGVEISYYC